MPGRKKHEDLTQTTEIVKNMTSVFYPELLLVASVEPDKHNPAALAALYQQCGLVAERSTEAEKQAHQPTAGEVEYDVYGNLASINVKEGSWSLQANGD